MLCVVLIALLAALPSALAGVALKARSQQESCAALQPFVSVLEEFDAAFVDLACAALLNDPIKHVTKTVTTTVTRTQTYTAATTTRVITTNKTKRLTETSYSDSTSYVTLTATLTSYHYSFVTQTSAYPAAIKARVAPQYEPGKPWEAFDMPLAIASKACSCYESEPRATTTATVTTKAREGITATKRRTTTKTVTKTFVTTAIDIQVIGVYTYVTEHPKSTLTLTLTTCRGANPTPAFNLQVLDSTPTRTDSYNNLYPTPTRAPEYDPFTFPFFNLNFSSSPPSSAAGGIFNIDCLGRLYVQAPGGGAPLFGAVDYFYIDFNIIHFLKQAEVEKRQYYYIYCHIGPAGFLNCRVPQPAEHNPLTMFQTCPDYGEAYSNPLVIANYQSPDAPQCFGFRFKTI